VLTGFDSIYTSGLYFGISFYTVNIGYQLLKNREVIKSNPFKFIINIINPLYLFTGPFPNQISTKSKFFNLKIFLKRLEIVNSELILGVFFAFILAPSFNPLLKLKESTEVIDILLFGIIFEFYVYFNFAGFSMIAWSFMRLFGINVKRNFNQPFSATSIVEYWQRWHISLSNILKELFFKKLKPKIGIYNSVFLVFLASALWHGVTINFLIWGFIHSLFWCISYYFLKRDFKILNYFLLFFGVIIGRIIFSEIDTEILYIKFKALFNVSQWNFNFVSEIATIRLRNSNILNILITIFLIFLEITIPKFSKSHKNYNYLRTPLVSTLILLFICLSFVGFNSNPIYGNR
jgi:D-alanyl-lipoteichoic acid acyltransferase DltB (MBOAT superfamily)